MKLASRCQGRDGQLIVVSDDGHRYLDATVIAPTLQSALDQWTHVVSSLEALARQLADDPTCGHPLDIKECAAPLPRAFHWVDGSAYVNHVELVRKARGAALPRSFWTDPLVYQGGSDDFLGPYEPARFASEDWGIDLEAEIAVVVGDVPMGSTAEAIRDRGDIKFVMLVNDWSLRHLIPQELEKGFGFYQSKPATAFGPFAVTPESLGKVWDGGKLHLAVCSFINDQCLGSPWAQDDMVFDFPQLIAHCAKTRNLRAGSIIGSGTVSNRDRSRGVSCLAEKRALEIIDHGTPHTPFLKFGDRVRIEVLTITGQSVFGAIDQLVAPID